MITLEDQYLEKVQRRRGYEKAIKQIMGPSYIVIYWQPAHVESLGDAIFTGCLSKILEREESCSH